MLACITGPWPSRSLGTALCLLLCLRREERVDLQPEPLLLHGCGDIIIATGASATAGGVLRHGRFAQHQLGLRLQPKQWALMFVRLRLIPLPPGFVCLQLVISAVMLCTGTGSWPAQLELAAGGVLRHGGFAQHQPKWALLFLRLRAVPLPPGFVWPQSLLARQCMFCGAAQGDRQPHELAAGGCGLTARSIRPAPAPLSATTTVNAADLWPLLVVCSRLWGACSLLQSLSFAVRIVLYIGYIQIYTSVCLYMYILSIYATFYAP